ncbi:hypothetical protein Gotri_014668 [Gossypium trilobum]|uniref:Transcriptional corepressor LEUNIG_HOMOLOG-like n=1 Tax=Gossypium trilobum TaxID=34281 RepID=A0A7J9DXH2_9ROSI|nr:hypothetical protein [Gossypium trilobum]
MLHNQVIPSGNIQGIRHKLCPLISTLRRMNFSALVMATVRFASGGSTNVRFQPRTGQFLAAAADNVVSIFDVETDRRTQLLQGHNTEVHSLCWDANGDFLASVSQESVRLWSLSSGECINELSSSGNKFHSCVFHPNFPALLVIGGYQVSFPILKLIYSC